MITYEVKFEPSQDGGSIFKVRSKYCIYKGKDFKLNEDEIKTGKEKVWGMYNVGETMLLLQLSSCFLVSFGNKEFSYIFPCLSSKSSRKLHCANDFIYSLFCSRNGTNFSILNHGRTM
ncbi:hypothetical protein M9H77_35304 [Catharanthus roseus]|uniref:Uncharacterized protein n=1 Tax=Catharanthus roseus TaxID=4058 RepID=A0ACB9ZPJ1_CATRO|nr:hypothetical protein M9H77_35304 [Catharanthus roseus]